MIQLKKKHTVPIPDILTVQGSAATAALCAQFAEGKTDFDFDNKIGFRVSQIQFEDVYSWIRGAFLVVASAPVLVTAPPPGGPMH